MYTALMKIDELRLAKVKAIALSNPNEIYLHLQDDPTYQGTGFKCICMGILATVGSAMGGGAPAAQSSGNGMVRGVLDARVMCAKIHEDSIMGKLKISMDAKDGNIKKIIKDARRGWAMKYGTNLQVSNNVEFGVNGYNWAGSDSDDGTVMINVPFKREDNIQFGDDRCSTTDSHTVSVSASRYTDTLSDIGVKAEKRIHGVQFKLDMRSFDKEMIEEEKIRLLKYLNTVDDNRLLNPSEMDLLLQTLDPGVAAKIKAAMEKDREHDSIHSDEDSKDQERPLNEEDIRLIANFQEHSNTLTPPPNFMANLGK